MDSVTIADAEISRSVTNSDAVHAQRERAHNILLYDEDIPYSVFTDIDILKLNWLKLTHVKHCDKHEGSK